jgi:hypothetical protein
MSDLPTISPALCRDANVENAFCARKGKKTKPPIQIASDSRMK